MLPAVRDPDATPGAYARAVRGDRDSCGAGEEEAATCRAAGSTAARHRQHVSASAWLIAPHVAQMASRMLMQ